MVSGSFQMKVWTLMIQRNLIIPGIRWSQLFDGSWYSKVYDDIPDGLVISGNALKNFQCSNVKTKTRTWWTRCFGQVFWYIYQNTKIYVYIWKVSISCSWIETFPPLRPQHSYVSLNLDHEYIISFDGRLFFEHITSGLDILRSKCVLDERQIK